MALLWNSDLFGRDRTSKKLASKKTGLQKGDWDRRRHVAIALRGGRARGSAIPEPSASFQDQAWRRWRLDGATGSRCRFRCRCFHRHCCRQVGRRRWQGRPIRQGRRYPSGTSQQHASSLAVVAGSSTFLPDTYVRPAENCGRLIVPIAPDTPSLHFRQTCIRPRIIPHLEAQRSGSAVAIV